MDALARRFEVRDAVRESVPLLVGLMGPSSSGKTFSSLRLATGIQSVTGGDIYVIDTEARRSLNYADTFKFKHMQFDQPFGSLDYLVAIEHCVKAGGKIIIVDQMSYEHDGPGGLLDCHDKELDRIAGDDYAKRERVKMLAWQKPKAARQRMLSSILQMNAHFLLNFRAKEKMRLVKGAIVPMGFMPIAGEEIIFELTANCLLMPNSGGVPTWRSDEIGERMMMKLPEQFKALFANSKPLDEDTGKAFARWARGGAAPSTHATPSEPDKTMDDYDRDLATAANGGTAALQAAWAEVPANAKTTLKVALDRRHKVTASQADAVANAPAEIEAQ